MGASTYVAPANEQTLMSTDLNALANDGTVTGAVIIDNTSNRLFYSVFELYLPQVDLSALTNPAVELYLVPSYDGTNYADTTPTQYLVAVMGVAETNAVHRAISAHVMLDPVKYTPVVINETGAALAGTGNTLKVKTYGVTTA